MAASIEAANPPAAAIRPLLANLNAIVGSYKCGATTQEVDSGYEQFWTLDVRRPPSGFEAPPDVFHAHFDLPEIRGFMFLAARAETLDVHRWRAEGGEGRVRDDAVRADERMRSAYEARTGIKVEPLRPLVKKEKSGIKDENAESDDDDDLQLVPKSSASRLTARGAVARPGGSSSLASSSNSRAGSRGRAPVTQPGLAPVSVPAPSPVVSEVGFVLQWCGREMTNGTVFEQNRQDHHFGAIIFRRVTKEAGGSGGITFELSVEGFPGGSPSKFFGRKFSSEPAPLPKRWYYWEAFTEAGQRRWEEHQRRV